MKNSNLKSERQAVKNGLLVCCLVITLSAMAQPSNKCLSFNGSNSAVCAIDDDLGLNYTNNVSVAAWVNWGSKANAGSNSIIATSSDSINSNGQFWLQHNADNSKFQFILQTDSMSKFTAIGTTNPVVGSWYYVVGVYDGSNVNLYVNGILEGSTAVTSGQNMKAFDSTYGYTIGANSKNTNHFNGLIDEVSVWALPLTSLMIQSSMCTRPSTTEKGLVSYYNMDTLIYDSLLDMVILDADADVELGATEDNCTLMSFGAPVGNNATQLSGSGPFVYVNPANGDSLIINSTDSAPNGMYVYEVNGVPADSLLPSGVSTSCTPSYYGIFIPGYQGTDTVTYYYDTTTCNSAGHRTASFSSPVLLNRNAQTSFNWEISNATIDLSNSKFSLVAHGGQNEFIMGSKTNNTTGIANAINNSLKVNSINPNPFSENFNLTINCLKNTDIKARIISSDGKLISERMLNCNQGENQVNFENMNEMASGVYFMNLSDGEGRTSNVKMVKN